MHHRTLDESSCGDCLGTTERIHPLDVTLHPAMGVYLSHLNNNRSDVAAGRFPDENYAREAMQLFSIGLFELSPDGAQRTDALGDPIPTYDNGTVRVQINGTEYTNSATWSGASSVDNAVGSPATIGSSIHIDNYFRYSCRRGCCKATGSTILVPNSRQPS